MDYVSFYKIPDVLETLRLNHCQTVMVLPGCTGILQPLDIHINKPLFKVIFTELMEEDTQKKEEDPKFKWNPSKKRIQITNCVAKAYRQLCD